MMNSATVPGRHLTGVNFPIGLECAARFQHRLPLHRVHIAAHFFPLGQQDVILQVENARGAVGAFQIFAELKEVPALAMGQRRGGGAVELMRTVHHVPEEIDGAGRESCRADAEFSQR